MDLPAIFQILTCQAPEKPRSVSFVNVCLRYCINYRKKSPYGNVSFFVINVLKEILIYTYKLHLNHPDKRGVNTGTRTFLLPVHI